MAKLTWCLLRSPEESKRRLAGAAQSHEGRVDGSSSEPIGHQKARCTHLPRTDQLGSHEFVDTRNQESRLMCLPASYFSKVRDTESTEDLTWVGFHEFVDSRIGVLTLLLSQRQQPPLRSIDQSITRKKGCFSPFSLALARMMASVALM